MTKATAELVETESGNRETILAHRVDDVDGITLDQTEERLWWPDR
jgi:hypothetical protein